MRGARVLAVTAGLLGCLAATGAAQAGATTACGVTGVFSQSGTSASCTYATAGTEDIFNVPAGTTSVSVTAVGARGGANRNGSSGGLGAIVTNAALPVTASAELWVDVGSPGAIGSCLSSSGGGFPDGGSSPACSGGGGGSSSLLTTPRASATLTGNVGTDSRLLVAGGGGGTGQGFYGASAGNPAVTGAGAGGCISDGGAGGVGPTDGTNGGGPGGCAGQGGNNYCWGAAGTATVGGVGSTYCLFGAGGGGGWFGGGGGGGFADGNGRGGAGGGGGSSYGGAGASAGVTIATASSGQLPQVTVTYTVSAADLAAKLVADSIGKGPGTALADKAAAIRSSFQAGEKAKACNDLTDYLRKVKDETGKTLSLSDAAQLTGDASNLAKAIGC